MRVRWIVQVVTGAVVSALVAASPGTAAAAVTGTAAPRAASTKGSADGARDDLGGTVAAVRSARASGHRVEVVGQRSETGRVFANPDGTFTTEEHVLPVRVRRGDSWAPVDTTLTRAPDGTVAPKAVTVGLAFSGGGQEPLVRLTRGDKRLELSWPGRLPRPTLDGDTATYADVLPGVDLRLKATVQGFTERLVVRNREAARNPALATVRFGLRTNGVSVRSGPNGTLLAVDAAGRTVFHAPAPQMWDSAAPTDTTRIGAAPQVAVGRHQAVARFRVEHRDEGRDEARLAVVPDQRMLTDPSVRFPVYIDPDFSAGRIGWTKVFSGKPNTSYWGGGDDGPLAKVGYCDWAKCNGIGVARSYFRFDVRRLLGTKIWAAEFRAYENWSPSCSARPVNLFYTGDVGPGTTWNDQPGATYVTTRNVAHGYSSACTPAWVGFNAVAAVRAAVSHRWNVLPLLLRADNEDDRYGWKKFDHNPVLTVTFNSLPDRPTNLFSEGKACGVEPNQPYLNPVNDGDVPLGPRLRARSTDPDGGLLRTQLEWYRPGGARVGEATGPWQSSGTVTYVTVPPGAFDDGDTGWYRARASDGKNWGPWSGMCHFTVDRTAPAGAPGVSSQTYPAYDIDDPRFGGGIGRTGGFTFTANDPDVAGFRYGLFDPPTRYVVAEQVGGSAVGLATPDHDLLSTLFVRSVDRAGNPGPVRTYEFLVGKGTPPVGHWRLEGLDETDVPDSSPNSRSGTVDLGPAHWTAGRVGDALWLDGASGHVVTTGGAPVHTDRTFSVAAWVRLDRDDGEFHAAVSQDGDDVFGYYLGYVPDQDRFAFRMVSGDSDQIVTTRAVADAPPTIGAWTHLTGVYDMATSRMRLYVDGTLEGTATLAGRWDARGAMQIGRVRYSGTYRSYWPGAVDEVRVYDRMLSAGKVHDLATTPTSEELLLPLDDGAGDVAADTSGNYRSGVLNDGATWTEGHLGGAVLLDGTSGTVTAAGPGVRTDNSFTVSAWARLRADNGYQQTVVSQDGPRSSGFLLQYEPASRKWRFVVSLADADSPAWMSTSSADPARVGEWTHLVGVYDAAAGQIRLYVDGFEVADKAGRTTANVAGDLVVGRMKLAGRPVAYLDGAVDNVHLYTGVRSGDQVTDEYYEPVTSRLSVYTGQLSRYVNHAGDHFSATGPAPAGYHFEWSLGLPAPPGAERTRLLYACRTGGTDEFTSADPGCEGRERLRVLGRFYTTPPEDVPTLPVYRCVTSSGDHFDSVSPTCEGRTTEFLLGYSRAYQHLVRYASPTYPYDHVTSITRVAADYRPESVLGLVARTTQPGTTRLMSCLDGTDAFASTDAGCEGKQVVGSIGRTWDSPPDGVQASAELFRCRASTSGLFESLDPACEGQAMDRSLGYVVTRLDEGS